MSEIANPWKQQGRFWQPGSDHRVLGQLDYDPEIGLLPHLPESIIDRADAFERTRPVDVVHGETLDGWPMTLLDGEMLRPEVITFSNQYTADVDVGLLVRGRHGHAVDEVAGTVAHVTLTNLDAFLRGASVDTPWLRAAPEDEKADMRTMGLPWGRLRLIAAGGRSGVNRDEVRYRVAVQAELEFEKPRTLRAIEAAIEPLRDLVRASLARAVFRSGADVFVRWAELTLEDAEFAAPSLVAPLPAPEPPGFLGREEPVEHGRWVCRMDGPSVGFEPRVVSVRRAKVASLTLSGVDLRACRFAGAHGLDGLRLERVRLAQSPNGWRRVGGRWPRMRWTRRQTVAEEHHWRAEPAYGTGWYEPREGCGAPDWLPDASRAPDAEQIASVYRALRKSREDNKDEPGAAEFYYGEMEMRRRAKGPEISQRESPRGERVISPCTGAAGSTATAFGVEVYPYRPGVDVHGRGITYRASARPLRRWRKVGAPSAALPLPTDYKRQRREAAWRGTVLLSR